MEGHHYRSQYPRRWPHPQAQPSPQLQNPNLTYQNPNFTYQDPNNIYVQNLLSLTTAFNLPQQQQQQQQQWQQNPLQQQQQWQQTPQQQQQPWQQTPQQQQQPWQQTPQQQQQPPSFPVQNPRFPVQQQLPAPALHSPDPSQPQSQNCEALIEKVDQAVKKVRSDFLAAGESVSAWKVSQAALVKLQIDSWNSLGFPMQQVPSLFNIIATEGKINAFIHCFVAVRKITSLYDLELAICENEGIKQFEDLGLGPLLRHPLVLHYFSVNSDATEIFKITSEEIIILLSRFVHDAKCKVSEVEKFLDFIVNKRSAAGKEKLGIRIQSLGMHVSTILKAMKYEAADLQNYRESVKQNSKQKKRPLFSLLKTKLDERFNDISQRVESFSSVHKNFRGKHTKFMSSSSEDEGGDDCVYEDDSDYATKGRINKSQKNFDRVSGCPYPSATEEITRLGLKDETKVLSSTSGSQKHHKSSGSGTKKRKIKDLNCTNSAPPKLRKMDKVGLYDRFVKSGEGTKKVSNKNEDFRHINVGEYFVTDDSLRKFIAIWKERCRGDAGKVFKQMLHFYKVRGHKRMENVFKGYPFIVLLNLAVKSIKLGMWHSIYDTVQAITQCDLPKPLININCEFESIDVEPSMKDARVTTKSMVELGVSVEDIVRKIAAYLKLDHEIFINDQSFLEKRFSILKNFSNCEHWLTDQFCVKEFKFLGHGDFLLFLEKNASLLPQELWKFLSGEISEQISLDVHMMHHQLALLLIQASNNLWENKNITKQDITLLLMRQFPFVSFKVVANGSLKDFLGMVAKDKNSVISKSVIFSLTLCASNAAESSAHNKNDLLESTSVRNDNDLDVRIHESVTTKGAIEVLLKAPMLSDINLWSHWDLIFAPSLGPLVPWLLKEVKTDELLCLVTRDGKVVRIDPSATVDSFLEAAIQGSSFQTAVKLLSLFSVVGGEKHVPVSLLKCHTEHAFKVILKNSLENMESNGCENSLFNGEVFFEERMVGEVTIANVGSELQNNLRKTNMAVSAISRFVLDCLSYLPAEIHVFAADVFLSGMQSVNKDAASAILCECKETNQRLMLHEVGLSLGVLEWINDYHAFCSNDSTDLFLSEAPGLKAVGSKTKSSLIHEQDVLDKFSTSEEGNMDASVREDEHSRKCSQVCSVINNAEVSDCRAGSGGSMHFSGLSEHEDAALVIESIRRDEFGLNPSLSNVESGMLKKQHARLGRALHCLSQELYSQDSHLLLELVQNADDNTYPENVEPTLTFILQDSGIIVLNNERGFSAQNIRALCDIGNSTKKGSNAGYIGQKGIGFKSVFRITDAPEIHSNGFHVKFDISEGQIGFVLPTVIPPCNLHLFSRLASSGSDQLDFNHWNTCIVLPFRSRISEGTVMKSIMTMFSDLHPSLLLFLHRLQCIKFRNLLEDSVIVMRKEIVGDGIINVSHGKEKMTWFVVSQKLRADLIRPGVQTTEISIAFTLQESANGSYSPHLSQQPVFSFLPLRTYGLKFIIQGDFVLPSSREEVDGNSPWNQWLLSEFPGLFVKAERSFCALPCFKNNPGKAVAAFMSFVPLVGEVHGFFSSLPRLIISKLRMSNCLLLDGGEWVPPCKVLRGWNEQARLILSDGLLHEHLGLGFLDKHIVLSDPLARTLGIEEYGPKILVQVITSLCRTKSGLNSMGLGWLSSCLIELYTMSVHFSGRTALDSEVELAVIDNLQNIPFIPLSNGTYGAVNEGTIWLHFDASSSDFDGERGIESFPNLYGNLRIVSPALLSASSVDGSHTDLSMSDKLIMMLYKVGVQRLSAHEITKVHILPTISDESITDKDKNLMTEYICFVMSHLQSSCPECLVEREYIMSELRNKAYILTNDGFKRPAEVSIHFSKEFGNPVDINKLIDAVDMKWHEVDISYLNHPITKALQSGQMKWREFFQGIGITDFVEVIQVEKSIADISHALLKNFMSEGDSISHGSIFKDWESHELFYLLSLLSRDGNIKNCEYLLEVLDKLWDSCFSDKATGYWTSNSIVDSKPFKSSFISTISDVKWVVSTMDDELHFPKDLYYDCTAVRSVLGASAPYAVPKVRSGKLVSDIGFKTKVTFEDILEMLKIWKCNTPFMASMAQMSKLYTFIWNEVALSNKLVEKFHSEPFIFVPYTSGSRQDDMVSGMFLSCDEVYWHDSTGTMDQMKEMHAQCSGGVAPAPLNKTLCTIYPGLHDFFVDVCGVHPNPSLPAYLEILLQLSSVTLPSQAAKAVFQVLLKWTDGLKSGLSKEEVVYLKESLKKVDCTVLPTIQDKWVSLHPSFGLVCWCDNKKLKKHFKNIEGVDFLYLGKLSKNDKEVLKTKVSVLMRALGIPALSEVVSREAVYSGVADSSFKTSLVNWALPYAQRYLFSVHPDKYSQLKQSGFDILNCLQVVVIEKLFYRNVIKSCGSKSDKRVESTCLLQDNILYTTQESDAHALFMELSRLFFDGNPELHMANFLHMVTTMVESGSSEDQTEFFILNSQKVPKLPDGESVWSLAHTSLLKRSDKISQTNLGSKAVNEQSPSRSKRKVATTTSNWPPADWKTAPGFDYARANGFKTQPSCDLQKKKEKYCQNIDQTEHQTPMSIDDDWTIEDDTAVRSTALVLSDSKSLEENCGNAYDETNFGMTREFDPIGLESAYETRQLNSSHLCERDQTRVGTPNAQVILTGRRGEHLAFKYFTGMAGKNTVKWVNEHEETGLPYDIVVEDKINGDQFIEVKATVCQTKNWFTISIREWQFAIEKGEAFSIAHVFILENNVARVSVFRNPVKLLQQRKLRLAIVMPMPTEQNFSVIS